VGFDAPGDAMDFDLTDVRVHQILEGTNEVMRLIVSRDMLGN
jgi:alkylation response protein AidB-like acyl-CoA dehydrogenase